MKKEQRRKYKNCKLKNKNKKKRNFITISNIILLCIVSILLYMIYGIYKEAKVRTLSERKNIQEWFEQKDSKNFFTSNNEEIVNKEYESLRVITMPEVAVDKEYNGYEVECKLEIPKIELNTNVLKEYSTNGLKICASKYYGPNANEIGNYCIAGHNYNKENMFNHLIDLEIGDSIFLIDNKNGIVEYIIYDMYKVKPQNIEPLSQKTEGKRELTLITCVNYSRNRLVVKAREVKK